MAYLRCTHCGSKALVAASQCPRCAQPFYLLNARGERAKLSRCRKCGIMHRDDATCHWCGVLPKASWQSPAVWRTAAAVMLSVTVAGAAWRYGSPMSGDLMQRLKSPSVALADVAVNAATAPTSNLSASRGSSVEGGIAPGSLPATGDSVVVTLSSADSSITWTPAVARTWVNVRDDASRGGQVVGVIKPASRAMLGTDRAGWRQVRSPDVNGWVDPRLFEADSLKIRGE